MAAIIRKVNAKALPKPAFHWSHAAEASGFSRMVFLAGQVGSDDDGKPAGNGDCAAQVRQAFKKLEIVLHELGMDMSNVVKFTAYLVRAEDIPAFTAAREELYREYYPDGSFPPTVLLVVDRLRPENLHFEIDAIAVG